MRQFIPRILFPGLIGLLIFSPLAFGSVEPWAVAVLESSAFLLFGLFLLRHGWSGEPVSCDLPAVPLLLAALFMAWSAAARVFSLSLDPHGTETALLLGAAYLAVFVVASAGPTDEPAAERLIQTLLVLGFGIAVVAILQLYTWNGKIYWLRPVREAMAYGPFINRNHLAGYLEMLIPAGLGFVIARLMRISPRGEGALRRWIGGVTDPNANRLVLMFFMVCVTAVALLLTLSRSGIVSFLSATVFIGAVIYGARGTRRWIALPVSLMAVLFLSMIWFGLEPLIDRLVTLRDPAHVPSWIERLNVWGDSLRMATDHPLFGTGLGTFAAVFPAYKTFAAPFRYDHAHNDFLELLAETGWVGFAVAMTGLALLGSGLLRGLGRRRLRTRVLLLGLVTGMLSILIHGLTDFNFHIPSNALLFTVLAGTAWRLSRSGGGVKDRIRPPARWRKAVAMAGLVLAAGLLYFSVSAGVADFFYRKGLDVEKVGKNEAAAVQYARAVGWDPGNPRYRLAVARVAEKEWEARHSGPGLEKAEEQLKIAVSRSPFEAEYRIHLGWVYARMAHYDRAALEFSKGLELDPTNPAWGHYAGLWFAAMGRNQLAHDAASNLKRHGFTREAEDIEKRL